MDFSVSDDQRAFRDEILKFTRAELNEDMIERDRAQEFRRDLWEKCGAMGLLGLPVPEEYGGIGLDAVSTAMALEALGQGCEDGGLVFSICAHLLSCVVPIWKHGTADQRQRYLPKLCSGEHIGVHAMTEPGSGSDAFNLLTSAVPDGDGWRINGTKTFISNGPVADVVIVFAMTDRSKGFHGGVTSFLVEKGAAGFSATQKIEKMGIRTSPFGELVFDNVCVGPESILGVVGSGATMFTQTMDWERVCLFAAHVGAMERLTAQAVAYARTRSQFGQQIGKFQAISHKIADMKIRLEASRYMTYRAAWMLDHSRSASLDASIAKVLVSDSLVATSLDALQIHGGYGYCAEYQVERAVRDAVGSRIYSGTNEMQRTIIARWLGL